MTTDNCVCFREIKDTEDTLKLQKAMDYLGSWSRKWGMRFQPVKCIMMQITRKRIKRSMLHILWMERSSKTSKVSSILGSLSQMICNGIHVSNICNKANRTLGFLRGNLYACPQEVKEAAFKWLARPALEYSGSVWDLSGVGFQDEHEKVPNRAARFLAGNYNYETGSMPGFLEHLKWKSLKKRRRDSRLLLLYKGMKGKTSIPLVRRCRNHHSLAYQVPIANTDIYKCSVFLQTIRDWNALPDSLIFSAEGVEDGVAKFTSLVRARE